MTLYSAFIKSNSRLFVFHRFKEREGLALTHLAFFFQLGFGNLFVLVERLLRFIFARAFHFTGEFLLRRFRWRS